MVSDIDLQSFIDALSPAQRDKMVQDIVRLQQARQASDELAQYRTPDGVVRFVREILRADPAPYQENILSALVIYKRVAVRAPHGAGKTALAAWVVWWMLLCFPEDVKVVTTAGAWRQLIHFLWPEIRAWSRAVRRNYPDVDLLNLQVRLPDNRLAFAAASDRPELIEGAHARRIAYIFDESKAIPAGTFDAAEGAFSTAGGDTDSDAYALAISTPGDSAGRFYDICTGKPGYEDWHKIHVTLEQCISAGRITREWAEQRKTQWGEQSPVYQRRVLGNFFDDAGSSVIPLTWVEAANMRWFEQKGSGAGAGRLSYGVDPARFGADKTAICRLVGTCLEKIDFFEQEDTMQTAGRVAALVSGGIPVGVDVIGIGAGVVDRLKELGRNVIGVNVAQAARDKRGKPLKDVTDTFEFVNLRSYMWWLLRDNLNPDNPDALALPPDDKLTGDLVAPQYGYTSAGLIKVEGKDEIRRRIGRSTDAADALALAVYAASDMQAVKVSSLRIIRASGLYRREKKTSFQGEN